MYIIMYVEVYVEYVISVLFSLGDYNVCMRAGLFILFAFIFHFALGAYLRSGAPSYYN